MPALFGTALCLLLHASLPAVQEAPPLRVLFLGDDGHHQPSRRAQQVAALLLREGIQLNYTEDLTDLSADTLRSVDCLLVYANQTRIAPEQERALLEFVEGGKGLVALHCASYCFIDSPKWVALVGAQFQKHGTGTFRERRAQPEHPVFAGVPEIESWDETYVHHRHAADRTILAERVEGEHVEPWTWVRSQGKGRVFYAAWGHDQRTWGNAAFQALLVRAIRWSSGDRWLEQKTLAPFRYEPARLPEYRPDGRQAALDRMQSPLSPEESLRRLVLPPGLRAELVLSEPRIGKPIALAFDEGGRLWLAETVDYPNDLTAGSAGRDRIRVCEDRDADGRIDEDHIFADGISIPTSLLCVQGGVVAALPPDLVFLSDTDGDGKADERKVLVHGFGTGDTHATVSNLRLGFDGWIWGTVGYSGFRGTVGGRELRFGQGIFRVRRDGSELEFVAATTNNTWGLGFSEEGDVFASTANGCPSVHMALPNRCFDVLEGFSPGALPSIADRHEMHPLTDAVRQVDFHGQFTAAAGHALYTARAFPRKYWNRIAFVCEPTGHVVAQFVMEPRGADFRARNAWNLLASDDEWTAPIVAEVGPDGAVWVIDWYNYIVQHNPTPRGYETGKGAAYVTPLRDKTHGRIWRIVPEAGAKRTLDLRGASAQQLVTELGNDNLFWRLTAQRLLLERNERGVVPELVAMVRGAGPDKLGLPVAGIHALWTLAGLGALTDGPGKEAVAEALGHASPAMRRTALEVLPRTCWNLIPERKLLADPAPKVRLHALQALAEAQSGGAPAADLGMSLLEFLQKREHQEDRRLLLAATAAAARHDAAFLEAALRTLRTTGEAAASRSVELVDNPDLERGSGARPAAFTVRHYSGEAQHAWAEDGRGGGRCVSITSRSGADSSWFTRIAVEPWTRYRLSGWIRTEAVTTRRSGFGALFNVHELQGERTVRTLPLLGTQPWTERSIEFETGEHKELTINCLFGGWGQAAGTAWFDDVRVTPLGQGLLPGRLGQVVTQVTRSYAGRGPADTVFGTLLALRDAPAELAVAAIDGLAAGWPAPKTATPSAAECAGLNQLLAGLQDGGRTSLLVFLRRLGAAETFAEPLRATAAGLLTRVGDRALPAAQRTAAAASLLQLRADEASVRGVLAALDAGTEPILARGLLDAVGGADLEQAGSLLLEHWRQLPPAAQEHAFSILLLRRPWTAALLAAIESERVPRTALLPDQWLQLQQHPDQELARRTRALRGTSSSAGRQAILQRLLPAAERTGDAARGSEVFQKQCVRCHELKGQGGAIGPSLTGIGKRPRAELLAEILDPNRSIEANYRLWNVETQDGRTLSGRLIAETRQSLELLDLTGVRHVIARKDLKSSVLSPLSAMPEGFEDLGEADLASLLEWLVKG